MLVVAACGGAGDVAAPHEPLPEGAVFIAVPGSYGTWWTEVEHCSGVTRPMSKVSWYYVPGAGFFSYGSISNLTGMWQPGRNAIILAEFARQDGMTVRHEELHAILRRTDHPSEYFVDKCGALVTH
jgi:hypothetical protein